MTNSDQSLRAMAIELDKLTASLKGFDKED